MSFPDFDQTIFLAMAPNEPKRIIRLAAAYERSTRDSLDKLASAIEQADLIRTREIGHKLKSGSKWFGALALGALGEQLEKLPDDTGLTAAAPLLEAAESSFKTLQGRVTECLASLNIHD